MPDNHPFWGGPVVDKANVRGTIKHWSKYTWEDSMGEFSVILGTLYTPDGSQRVATAFRTSTIVAISDDETMCETRNSMYRLEDKREP